MIYLLPDLIPVLSLHIDEDSSPAFSLIRRVQEFLKVGDRQGAEPPALEALHVARQQRHPLGEALALLCISDVYRETDRSGPALRMALQAYEILQRQPHPAQRHNEGIAAYSLGLIHHIMGNSAEALNWYATARQRLTMAREYWSAHKEQGKALQCASVEKWIASLSNVLVTMERPADNPIIIFPVPGDEGHSPLAAEIEVRGYLLGNHLKVGGRTVRVITFSGQGFLVLDRECRIFSIPDSACAQIGAQRGDYVLARREEKVSDAPYYIVETDAGADFLRFHRRPDGSIIAESLTTGRVIGGPGDPHLPTYRPLALLRPV